jgi:hypothetical protein
MEPTVSAAEPTPSAEEVAYEVYAYDLPKLTEDGESALPTKPVSTERFPSLEAAQTHARAIGSNFERVQLLRVTKTGDKTEPKLVSRLVNGTEERAEDIVRR